jgi:hypothetical protein
MPAKKAGTVFVILDKRDDKKNSVKYYTEDSVSPSNIYINNDEVRELGDPSQIEVMIKAKA